MDNLLEAASSLTDYESVREFLYGLRYHGAKYGLDRMLSFSRALGDPQNELKCIHVAGTNGKGSTCSMIEGIYRKNGYRTGFYSSPHLIRQGERIQVDREIMSESEIVAYTKKMVEVISTHGLNDVENWPSFFEFMTAMGFLKFKESSVDISIIETGLGGRLDATNILSPIMTVITSISLDHTAILGNDIETIAFEKAGIMKAGVPVVIGHLPSQAERVIRDRADELHCEVFAVKEKWGSCINDYPVTSLRGPHQRINAAMASLVAEVLQSDFPVKKPTIDVALNTVDWPGRWEEVYLNENKQRVILDSSHNEEGAKMLESNLDELISESDCKPIIVTGSLGDDRARHLVKVLSRYADQLIMVQPNQPRALSPDEMAHCVPDDFEGEIRCEKIDDLFMYQSCMIEAKEGQTVLVTGSIYLIGEISDLIKSDRKIDQQCLQDVV